MRQQSTHKPVAQIHISDAGIDHIAVMSSDARGQARVCLILSDETVAECINLLNEALLQRAFRAGEL